jgi:hypothetical protein
VAQCGAAQCCPRLAGENHLRLPSAHSRVLSLARSRARALAHPRATSRSLSLSRARVLQVLEIPSTQSPYDPNKDQLMKRVLQMLGEA